MKWTKEAEEAVSRVPFFVRKRVRKRVEEEAARCSAGEVGLEHVKACQRRFLDNMEEEVRGYQVDQCFGPGGCPNRAVEDNDLARKLEEYLRHKNLRAFLRDRVRGSLKLHHELRISISDCPNACSRPQIVDVGLIGAAKPEVTDEPCTQCGACVTICKEEAILLAEEVDTPVIDPSKCLACGQCIRVCPSGTIKEAEKGYRLLVGGKLGRHPQLGRELQGIFSLEDAFKMVERCIEHYLQHNTAGERFGDILKRVELET